MVELNASERKALTLATALVVLGTAVRLGFGPGPAAWAWSPADDGAAESSAAEVGEAVDRNLARARRASRPLAADERLDPNRAPEVELDRLPGVGPSTARAIVASREDGGPFRWREDLLRVRGIGPATLAKIAPHVALAPSPPGPAASGGRGPVRGSRERAAASRSRIDVNRASARELESLPGVGPALARRIVELRQREGRLTEAGDLLRVRGIGPARLAELRDRVTF